MIIDCSYSIDGSNGSLHDLSMFISPIFRRIGNCHIHKKYMSEDTNSGEDNLSRHHARRTFFKQSATLTAIALAPAV
jgi:hypothetical protein